MDVHMNMGMAIGDVHFAAHFGVHFAAHQELDARQDLADEDHQLALAVLVHAPVAEEKVDHMLRPELLRGQAREADVTERTRSEPCQACLLYTSPSPRDKRQSRMPSSA